MNKKTFLLFSTSIIYMVIGLVFILVPVNTLIWLTFIILGILIILFNIPTLIEDINNYKNVKKDIPGMVFTILCIILGLILIFWQKKFLLIAFGIYLIIFPVYKILIAEDRKKQLQLELPKIILGIISIILGPENTMNIIFKAIGIIIIIASIIYLICAILLVTKYKEKNEEII